MSGAAEFVLTAPSQPIAAQSQLVIGFMLVNRSAGDMYFNTRFAVVPATGDVWPTLIGPSGDPIPYALRVRMAPLAASDFLLLKPNETALAGTALRRLFRFDQAGVYKLSATYISREVPATLANRAVFVGELDAEPISFTL